VTPVHITSERLNYADPDRKVFFDGGVTAKSADATMTGQKMTVFLLPRSQSKEGTNPAMPGQVDRIIAEDQVVLTQPTRHATGEPACLHVGGRKVRPDRRTSQHF